MGEITVVLNVFKRPYLEEQVKFIEKQSIKPKEIIINQNGNFVDIPQWIKDKYTVVQSNKNWGVWFRFMIGLHATTEYICFFDDDTIPGKRRLENCLNCIQKQDGMYGTVGHIYQNREQRSPQLARPGWTAPNENIVQTDIIGHSWFLRTKRLAYMFLDNPPFDKRPYNAEDIWLSYSLQKQGINSYIAPHPIDDKSVWGSLKAIELGGDEHANWYDKMPLYQEARKYIIDKGFKLLIDKYNEG